MVADPFVLGQLVPFQLASSIGYEITYITRIPDTFVHLLDMPSQSNRGGGNILALLTWIFDAIMTGLFVTT